MQEEGRWGRFAGRPNLSLIGMPGCGKSTVARQLGEILGVPYVDTDKAIVSRYGQSIAEIFATQGEEAFRRMESAVLAEVLAGEGQIVATGGGCVERPENRKLLQQRSFVVWLDPPLPMLLSRLRQETDRPLLAHGDPGLVMEQLNRRRRPLYRFADLHLTIGREGSSGAVARLATLFSIARSND